MPVQGSGKDEMQGVLPRTLKQVAAYQVQREKQGWSYDMRISFFEIYKETIRDLLRNKEEDIKIVHEIRLLDKHSKNVGITNLMMPSVVSLLAMMTLHTWWFTVH